MVGVIELWPDRLRAGALALAAQVEAAREARVAVRGLPALSPELPTGAALHDFAAAWAVALAIGADDCDLVAATTRRAVARWESTEHALAGVHGGGQRPL